MTLMVSLLLGAGAAGFISRKITEPVAKLAAKVRNFDYTRKIRLERTGIEELDLLSQAVEISNQNLLDNTLKMSEIMDLLGLHIGAFEYSPGGYGVQVTKQIFPLMELPCEDENHLYVMREYFCPGCRICKDVRCRRKTESTESAEKQSAGYGLPCLCATAIPWESLRM